MTKYTLQELSQLYLNAPLGELAWTGEFLLNLSRKELEAAKRHTYSISSKDRSEESNPSWRPDNWSVLDELSDTNEDYLEVEPK